MRRLSHPHHVALGLVLAAAVAACVGGGGVTGSTADQQPPASVDATSLVGSWQGVNLQPMGTGFTMTLATAGSQVSGTGRWVGEAGPSGPVSVSGTVVGSTVTLTITYGLDPQFAGSNPPPARVDHFTGKLTSATSLEGTITDASGSADAIAYRKTS